jgi:hypothetical protein
MSGWKNAFKYAKSLAGKHGLVSPEAQPRADAGLPLNAKIGSLIQVQPSFFVRANILGSLMSMTGSEDMRIKAVSKLNLGQGGGLFRFYIETGDVSGAEKFVQVYQSASGVVSEMMMCSKLTRIIPETAEDQEAYTGEAGFGLGSQDYSLWREMLTNDGVDSRLLQGAFGVEESLKYLRDKGDPSVEFVSPLRGTEIRVDDAMGEKGLEQEVYYMPYVRTLIGGEPEYLLITTEIVRSRDGDKNKRAIHVDFMIGLPISLDIVTII